MFKIGQKVICKDDTASPLKPRAYPKGITRGKIYEIAGLDRCEFCGLELILLKGVNSGSRKECICGSWPIFPTNAFLASRFELPAYNTTQVDENKEELDSMLEVLESPILPVQT